MGRAQINAVTGQPKKSNMEMIDGGKDGLIGTALVCARPQHDCQWLRWPQLTF